MSGAEALAALAAGRRPSREALLPSCMVEGWGTRLYGEEVVLEAFRSAANEEDSWDIVEDDAGAALIGRDLALIADTFEGRLLRVWRIGPGPCLPAEPAVSVPFDTDLHQGRADVFAWELAAELEPAIAAAGRQLLGEAGGYRGRAFPVRVIASGPDAVILFALFRMSEGPVKAGGFSYAAARLHLEAGIPVSTRLVRDVAGEAAVTERPLMPRI
jgi:hypothetical protein